MNKLSDDQLTGKNLVFIVGCPRSGTTWLQRLLATHAQIKTGQESHVFEYVGTQFQIWRHNFNPDPETRDPARSSRGIGLANYLDEAEFFAIQKIYLGWLIAPMLRDLQPGQLFLEKSPRHALWLREIAQLLPQAKIIHLARDPRDVVASLLAASRGWGQSWAPRRASKAARNWAKHLAAVQAGKTFFPAAQFLEVHYEDLHQNPAVILQRITKFLGLPWAEADIVAAVKINAADELRQGKGTPIPVGGEHGRRRGGVVREPEGFIRKARPGSWREDLTWLDRWRVRRVLRKHAPGWERYAKG
jgi:hypothetical protein